MKIEEVERYTLHERITPGGKVVAAQDMDAGDIGVIDDPTAGGHNGVLVMRQYDQLIGLNRRNHTWHIDSVAPRFIIRLLKPTDAITIVMK